MLTYINTIVSYRPVLYVYLHKYNCQLQASLICIPKQIQLSSIDQYYMYIQVLYVYHHTYNCQLKASLLCIQIQLSAKSQPCVYNYTDTIFRYITVLYIYRHRYNCLTPWIKQSINLGEKYVSILSRLQGKTSYTPFFPQNCFPLLN